MNKQDLVSANLKNTHKKPLRNDSNFLPIEEIKYVFNIAALQPGDILLMNTYHESQRKIMVRDCGSCTFDHAAIYIGDAYLMEANGLGVVMNRIYSYGFKAETDACILRLKKQSPALIDKVIYTAKSYMGMEFNTSEARAVKLNKNTDKEDTSNRTFCSRLVAKCYSEEGINLVQNPAYCTPDDFLVCDLLEKVESPLELFTVEMEATVKNAQNESDDFKNATFWAAPFLQFSKLYGEDIQTMGQLLQAASKHIDKDDEALKIISENNLFQPEDDTKKYWPWLEKDEDFFNHYDSTEKQMFFLNNQFLHFDLTYIPSLKQNFISLCYAKNLVPKSKLIARIKQGFEDNLRETIKTRKRLIELFYATANRDEKGFFNFIKKYGLYKDYENIDTTINIDHILHDIMKVSGYK